MGVVALEACLETIFFVNFLLRWFMTFSSCRTLSIEKYYRNEYKKKHVTWPSLLLCNSKLHIQSHNVFQSRHSQSVQSTVQRISYNPRSVPLEFRSGRSIWVAGVVVEQG